MRGLMLALGVTLFGCANTEATEFHGSTRFSTEERLTIETAGRWMAAHSGREAMPIVWDWDQTRARNWSITRGPAPLGPEYDGQGSQAYIYLDADRISGPDCLLAVAAHEWGHQMGLSHLPEGQAGIMSPTAGCKLEWTEADEANAR